MRDTQDPSRVQEESQPSDELLQEAARAANKATGLRAEPNDVELARKTLEITDPLAMGPWELCVNGYVAVARRGGRS